MSKKILIPIEIDSGVANTSGLKFNRLTSTSPTTAGVGYAGIDAAGNVVVAPTPAGAAGSTTYGTATLDFGAFPGASDASVVVTGQASIVAGSTVCAWIKLVATADHTADEHFIETIKVSAGNIVAGTGFTIYGVNTNQINEPTEVIPQATSIVTGSATAIAIKVADPGRRQHISNNLLGGLGTRLYGTWSVSWSWT